LRDSGVGILQTGGNGIADGLVYHVDVRLGFTKGQMGPCGGYVAFSLPPGATRSSQERRTAPPPDCGNDIRLGLGPALPLQQLEVMQNARAFRQGTVQNDASGNPAAPEEDNRKRDSNYPLPRDFDDRQPVALLRADQVAIPLPPNRFFVYKRVSDRQVWWNGYRAAVCHTAHGVQ
jgi:hypothetical protein